MRLSLIPALVGALTLTACASTQINQAPVPYTTTKRLGEVGTSSFVVRTFAKVAGKRSELTGVACSFAGDGFKSSFTTPALVISPNMQGRTPPASVSCLYQGETITRPITPFNETVAGINSGAMAAGAGAGLVGLLVGGAVAAAQTSARDVNQDVYGYADVEIVFEH